MSCRKGVIVMVVNYADWHRPIAKAITLFWSDRWFLSVLAHSFLFTFGGQLWRCILDRDIDARKKMIMKKKKKKAIDEKQSYNQCRVHVFTRDHHWKVSNRAHSNLVYCACYFIFIDDLLLQTWQGNCLLPTLHIASSIGLIGGQNDSTEQRVMRCYRHNQARIEWSTIFYDFSSLTRQQYGPVSVQTQTYKTQVRRQQSFSIFFYYAIFAEILDHLWTFYDRCHTFSDWFPYLLFQVAS